MTRKRGSIGRIAKPFFVGMIGIFITVVIYMLFNDGLIPVSYLGDFTLEQLCTLNLLIFVFLSMLVGLEK